MTDPRAHWYFREILSSAPDAMVLVDPEGVIVFANTAAHALFGYSEGQLEGHTIEVLVPKRFRMAHRTARGRFLDEGGNRSMGERGGIVGVRGDGTEFHADISLGQGRGELRSFTIASIRDLTREDRVRHERNDLRAEVLDLRRRLAELEGRSEPAEAPPGIPRSAEAGPAGESPT